MASNDSIVTRISTALSTCGMTPQLELMKYALACDSYSSGLITADKLQHEMCIFLDETARRSRTMSEVLSRKKEPAISEVFTEATIMLFDSIVRSESFSKLGWKVTSENNIKVFDKKYIKPDVALWKNEKLIAVIECKTSLGFARNTWESDFKNRVELLKNVGVKEQAVFLFVASENCWQGFSTDDPRTLKTWFSLCPKNTWFGGGKQGEQKLSNLMYPGRLLKMIDALFKLSEDL